MQAGPQTSSNRTVLFTGSSVRPPKRIVYVVVSAKTTDANTFNDASCQTELLFSVSVNGGAARKASRALGRGRPMERAKRRSVPTLRFYRLQWDERYPVALVFAVAVLCSQAHPANVLFHFALCGEFIISSREVAVLLLRRCNWESGSLSEGGVGPLEKVVRP